MNEILRPGKYYLGDPFTVLHPKILKGIWGDVYDFANGKFVIDDHDFVVHNTHNGDGILKDTKNRSYNIENGMIALIHVDLIEENLKNKNGHLFEFKNKIHFVYDAGIFYIKSNKKYIQIDTRNLDEYDSDFEEHCENENGEYISSTIIDNSDDDKIFAESDNDSNSEDEKSTPEILTKKFFK